MTMYDGRPECRRKSSIPLSHSGDGNEAGILQESREASKESKTSLSLRPQLDAVYIIEESRQCRRHNLWDEHICTKYEEAIMCQGSDLTPDSCLRSSHRRKNVK